MSRPGLYILIWLTLLSVWGLGDWLKKTNEKLDALTAIVTKDQP